MKSIILAWWLWALSVLIIIGCTMLLASCAPLPFCDTPMGYAANTSVGTVTLFDAGNTAKLDAMIKGLSAGTCQLDKGGT